MTWHSWIEAGPSADCDSILYSHSGSLLRTAASPISLVRVPRAGGSISCRYFPPPLQASFGKPCDEVLVIVPRFPLLRVPAPSFLPVTAAMDDREIGKVFG